MLKHLSIKNLLLIDQIDFVFNQGLCVLTGETGAGKSMILDSLSLISGNRARNSLRPPLGKKTSITALFNIKYFNNINWREIEDISDIGTNLSSLDHRKGETVRGNIGRVKKHPKNGEPNQWMNIDDMIRDVSKLTGMTRLFYNDHWKDIRNVREFREAKT